MTTTTQPFLQELDEATKIDPGLSLIQAFLEPDQASNALNVLNNNDLFPWDLTPKLYGQRLEQHAYHYNRNKAGVQKAATSPGLALLEELCQKVEGRFDVNVSDVYCNRFENPSHQIEWHKDTYGSHIFVLSLGSERQVQFRPKKAKDNDASSISTFTPQAGDIYLSLNKTHVHRVCRATQDVNTAFPRLSFVFFANTPAYATDYKITLGDKVRGAWEGFLS